jgi:ANTAR domain
MDDDFYRQSPELSRKELDWAIGALMGLRGCSEHEAFQEIADAAHQTGIGLGGHARALLALVRRGSEETLSAEALRYWRPLIPQSSSQRPLTA